MRPAACHYRGTCIEQCFCFHHICISKPDLIYILSKVELRCSSHPVGYTRHELIQEETSIVVASRIVDDTCSLQAIKISNGSKASWVRPDKLEEFRSEYKEAVT